MHQYLVEKLLMIKTFVCSWETCRIFFFIFFFIEGNIGYKRVKTINIQRDIYTDIPYQKQTYIKKKQKKTEKNRKKTYIHRGRKKRE